MGDYVIDITETRVVSLRAYVTADSEEEARDMVYDGDADFEEIDCSTEDTSIDNIERTDEDEDEDEPEEENKKRYEACPKNKLWAF